MALSLRLSWLGAGGAVGWRCVGVVGAVLLAPRPSDRIQRAVQPEKGRI